MKNVDNLKLWCLFRQRLSLQGEQNIVSAIDNALGKLGLVINSDNEIVSDKEQGEQKSTKKKLQELSDGKRHLGWLDDADKVIEGEQKPAEWSIFDFRTWQYIVSDVLTKKDGIGQYLDSGECKKIAKYMQEEWGKKLSIEQAQEELPKGEDYGIDGIYAAIDILTRTIGEVDGYQTDDGILEHKCAISAVKSLYEQKPAWSEEDELHLRELESLVKQVWAIAEHENDKDTIHKMSDLSFFLKTLKPQPKQELSEDDKRIIDNLISQLGNLYARKLIKEETKDKYVNLLKSIKERCTWKPSDEQMDVLNEVIRNPYLSTAEYNGLVALREQLKAL